MEAAQSSWRSLGELFVERGLISEADLERALAEEVATKRRLADILVRRGLVTGHDITSALMEQLGTAAPVPARQEPTVRPVAAAPPPAPAPEREPAEVVALSEAPPPAEPEPAPEQQPAAAAPVAYQHAISAHALIAEADARRRSAEAELVAARDAHAQMLRGLEQVRAELEARDLATAGLANELEQTQIRLRKREDELAEQVTIWEDAHREAERCGRHVAELQARLDEKESELSEATECASAWSARASELDAETEVLAGRVESALQALETLAFARFAPNGADLTRPATPGNEPPRSRTAQTGALYFVPKAEGYDLIEREGDVPDVGAALEFGNRQFVVTKIGRSPLPFDQRSCVFLTAI